MMKIKFRVTLLWSLTALTVMTGGVIGGIGFLGTRETAADLTRQILEQASLRVDSRIRDLAHAAKAQAELNAQLIEDKEFVGNKDFPLLARYWVGVMKVRKELSNIALTFAADGRTLVVNRRPDGPLAVQELVPDPAKPGVTLIKSYLPKDYHRLGKPFFSGPGPPNFDRRQQAWYRDAIRADGPIWTETYLFFNWEGRPDLPGSTYAVPCRTSKGDLLGVLAVDVDVIGLCSFLKTLRMTAHGNAFIVEQRSDGTRQVIAHPDADMVLRQVGAATDESFELRPTEEQHDPLVNGILAEIPKDVDANNSGSITVRRFYSGGVSCLGAYRMMTETDAPPWMICIVLPEDDVLGTAHHWLLMVFLVGLSAMLAAFLASNFIAEQVARPLERVHYETEAVGRFDVEPRTALRSFVLEVDRLAVSTEDMKTSLRSFRKYVPADLVQTLFASGKEAVLGGSERTLSIFFCDIADFTHISEELTPQRLVEQLGQYFQAFSLEVQTSGGTVDKYIGDAVMAFWGAPRPDEAHAAAACRAAVRCQQALARLRDAWKAEGKPEFHVRIGVNTGDVVVGNIGSDIRLNYTVIGDAVNVASRLEGLNKIYGSRILISDATRVEAGPAVVTRPLDLVTVKGKTEPTVVYELLGLVGEVDPELAGTEAAFVDALARHRRRDWAGAAAALEAVLQTRPDDVSARILAARYARFAAAPPAADWDGINRIEAK